MFKEVINSNCKYLLVLALTSLFAFTPAHANLDEAKVSIATLADTGPNVTFLHVASNTVQLDSCAAYFKGVLGAANCRAGEVPIPAATWLFVLALAAFVGLSSKKKL
jgi:hypothetical protein